LEPNGFGSFGIHVPAFRYIPVLYIGTGKALAFFSGDAASIGGRK